MPYADPERQREFRRLQMRRLRAENPELYRASRAASMRRHPENRRKWESSRRARKLDQFVEEVDPVVVYAMHGGMCGVCEEYVDPNDFHVDHVIPLSRGGLHGYINVQPAHPICNLRKGDGRGNN